MTSVLLLATVSQLAWAELRLVREGLPELQVVRPVSAVVSSPNVDFVRQHVPPGQTILYVTGGQGIPELYGYYQMSYLLTPRNSVWWGAERRPTVVDPWLDVSGGTSRIAEVAKAKGAHFLVFSGRPVAAGLHTTETWQLAPAYAVVHT